MRSREEAGDRPECTEAQIIISLYLFKVVVHCCIGMRVTRVGRRAETYGEGEDVLASLARISPHSMPKSDHKRTSVSIRDFPVPELWTTEIALA